MSEHVLAVEWFARDPGGGTLNVQPCRCETDPRLRELAPSTDGGGNHLAGPIGTGVST